MTIKDAQERLLASLLQIKEDQAKATKNIKREKKFTQRYKMVMHFGM